MKKKWFVIPVISFVIIVALVTVLLLFRTSPDSSISKQSEQLSNLSDFYEDNHAGVSDSVILFTDSSAVDFAVEEIMSENGYTERELLKQWRDEKFAADCYYVLFDNNNLYCIKETDKGEVFYTQDDYQYYLEVME